MNSKSSKAAKTTAKPQTENPKKIHSEAAAKRFAAFGSQEEEEEEENS
jgi:hypothetical protein